jgi:CBS domain-containing protein
MEQTVRDIMTTNLVTCPSTATITDAARLMRDRDIGDVLVTKDGQLRGIVTDRDIVVRCIAEGADMGKAQVSAACSSDLTTITSDTPIEGAVKLMEEKAIRRLAVVDDGKPVGIVSIGDLAIERDPKSALGKISKQRPNN